jgi:nicotinate-nucleotide pyrophosphorylase (carboxylating)
MFTPAETEACRRLIELALNEDLGTVGDLTSQAIIPADRQGQAVFVARSPGVVAGIPAAGLVFAALEPRVAFQDLQTDGSAVERGSRLATVAGPLRAILVGERTALNFLQRLSGIATLTRRYVEAVRGLSVQILDTRKTTPGWRLLEKFAVRQGGAVNHRVGLLDGVLIKDNHLAPLGGGPEAVTTGVRLAREKVASPVPVEVEVENLKQLDAALAAQPDIVLLDNMTPELLREAVRRRNAAAPGIQLEASGGVTLATVRAIAETGVDRISVGALTHSATALDIALDYQA